MNRWRVTTDRNERRAYVLPSGAYIQRDGAGRMCWTVYYPDHDPTWERHPGPSYGMTDTLGEAKAWGESA